MRTWVHIDDVFPIRSQLYPEGSYAVAVSGLSSCGMNDPALTQRGTRWDVLEIQEFYTGCFGGSLNKGGGW